MIELLCARCGKEIEVDITTLGFDHKIEVIPCSCVSVQGITEKFNADLLEKHEQNDVLRIRCERLEWTINNLKKVFKE